MGHFVDKGFDEEAVLAVIDGTPGAKAQLHRHVDLADPVTGNIVIRNRGRVLGIEQVGVDIVPADRLAILVEPAAEAAGCRGTVMVLRRILFARPDHLDRIAGGLGDPGRHDDIVAFRPAPEAAAEIGVVIGDVLEGETGGIGGGLAGIDRGLVARPDIAFAVAHPGGAVHRLHRRMGQERHLIFGFDPGCRVGEIFRDIAFLGFQIAAFVTGFIEMAGVAGEDRVLVQSIAFGLAIFRVDAVQRLLRLPVAIGDDGDKIPHVEDLQHTGHGFGGACVHRLNGGADHRSGPDRGIFHARDFGIDPEQRAAIDLFRNIVARLRLPHDLVLVRRLELGLRRQALLRRGDGKF